MNVCRAFLLPVIYAADVGESSREMNEKQLQVQWTDHKIRILTMISPRYHIHVK